MKIACPSDPLIWMRRHDFVASSETRWLSAAKFDEYGDWNFSISNKARAEVGRLANMARVVKSCSFDLVGFVGGAKSEKLHSKSKNRIEYGIWSRSKRCFCVFTPQHYSTRAFRHDAMDPRTQPETQRRCVVRLAVNVTPSLRRLSSISGRIQDIRDASSGRIVFRAPFQGCFEN